MNVKNHYLQGVLYGNSLTWNLHPLIFENVILNDMNVQNPISSENGDGIYLDTYKNTLIVKSTFDVSDNEK